MKVTYNFDLPEDYHEHAVFSRAKDMYLAIEEVLGEIRSSWKYDSAMLNDKTFRFKDGDISRTAQDFLEEIAVVLSNACDSE